MVAAILAHRERGGDRLPESLGGTTSPAPPAHRRAGLSSPVDVAGPVVGPVDAARWHAVPDPLPRGLAAPPPPRGGGAGGIPGSRRRGCPGGGRPPSAPFRG